MEKPSGVDSEQLIATIKKHENIWNKYAKEYHKKNMKEGAWNKVCEELLKNWDSLSEDEKNHQQLILKKRWNNIRDYYRKDLAMQLNGSIGHNSAKRKKYMFSNKLDFLRPIFGEMSNEKKSADDKEDEDYVYITYSSESEDSLPLAKKEKMAPKTLEESGAQTEVTEPSDSDSDLLFLKSLLPDIKALNRRQKIDFKLGILQLYKKITSTNQHGNIDPLDSEEDRKFPLE